MRLPAASKPALRLTFAALCVGLLAAQAALADDSLFGSGSLGGSRAGLSLREEQPQEAAKPLTIQAIELGGVERVDTATVLRQVRIKTGDALDPALVAEDLRRIFAMGLFDDVRVGLKRAGDDQVIVRYQVLERPSIAAIDIRGNEAQSRDDIMKVVDLRIGNLYAPAEAAVNVGKIKDLYTDEGYFLAAVSQHAEPMPGNQVRVVFEVQERAEVKVRRIDLLGNEGVSDADIKAVLRTQEGSIFSIFGKTGNFKREHLDYDMQLIQYFYLTKGFIQAKVEEPVVSLSPDMKYISVSIRVHEGPQFKVGKVSITGDPVDTPEELMKKVQLKSGEIFNYALVQADGTKLAGAQKNYGFAHASVSNESVPDMDKRTVDWTYHIQRGKKVYFGQIIMQGGGSTRDKVIRREMVLTEGDLYSEEKIEASQARIQRLGYFEKVEVKTRPTALPQVVDVIVDVKERTTGTFQVGMGFSSLDNFITTAQISKDNFLGRGQRMSVQGSLSKIRTMFQASFFEPYFLDTKVTFSIDLFSYEQLYADFSRRSTGATMSWGYRLTDQIIAEASYNLEKVTAKAGGYSGRVDVPVASLFTSGWTSSVRGTLTYDSRDDRMFPTTGWHLAGTAEWATKKLGGDNEFTRYTTRLRRYVPLPFDGVLKFNLVGGIISAPTGEDVPLFERFFIGGIYNVRGYQRNSLGPKIYIPASSDPMASMSPFRNGGTRQLYLNNEVEVPILKAPMNLRGLVFFDIGNAFGEGETVSLSAMRMSFGWGVRWFSPVGPLRFEWGIPIKPQPGEDPMVFEFTIGNSF